MKTTPRRAAVLVCVLVVLLLVGMMSIQATQTLLIIRRGDEQRQRLQQARELLDLGRHAVLRMSASLNPEEIESRELVWELELPEGTGQIRVSWNDARAEESGDVRREMYRIVAKYPAASDNAAVVSWNSDERGFERDEQE